MLVIRDALLSQLQKDRLRQEIILAELAKIERAMALRAADAERDNPVAPFSFLELEEMLPRSREAVGGHAGHSIVAGAVDNNDLKKKKEDGARGGVELESQKPATDDRVHVKTYCDAEVSSLNMLFPFHLVLVFCSACTFVLNCGVYEDFPR